MANARRRLVLRIRFVGNPCSKTSRNRPPPKHLLRQSRLGHDSTIRKHSPWTIPRLDCLQSTPVLFALQEILPSTEVVFKSAFEHTLPFQVSSFDLAVDRTVLNKKRMFGELILSKFPMEPQSPDLVRIPWTERLLSAKVTIGTRDLILHTTHIMKLRPHTKNEALTQ